VPIWDRLSPAERHRHIDARLTPGRVVLFHCDFTTPPKDKFLVIASVEPEPLFLVINSTVNQYIRKREDLSRCQVEIGHEEHAFLEHHSFIDCTQTHKVALRDVYEQLERDIGRLKDNISTPVREQIIAAVKFARTLSPKLKAIIVSSLEQA
jgi:hypothetical protein